ncbi:MAG: AbrB/MazE/SpoVT family DNA-binding domain-containing protein [Ignavibacteria bacterium]|nr:AbrB/MazE/SpoVT family DNA-binding domain-containing protein [Ignavibacteria bacterium]
MDTIKIEHKGKKQILNIPSKYNFEEDEVYIKKIGNSLVIQPVKNPWNVLINSLDKFSEDFMSKRDQPELDKRESFK